MVTEQLSGRFPIILQDEALYRYADKNYKDRNDPQAKSKIAILNRMVKMVIT